MSEAAQGLSVARVDPGRWVDEHGDSLFRYALVRIRDSVVAQDLVQETFLAALKSADRFRGGSSERSWLIGILKHKIIDHIRKVSRERPHLVDEPPPKQVDDQMDAGGHWRVFDGCGPREWTMDASTACQQKEFWEVLNRCLRKLQPRTAQAFTLREMEDVSSDVVCEVMNITATNLWVMLHRARAQLRLCLEINWFDITAKPGKGIPRWLEELNSASSNG